jgi:hypothetical protein
MSLLGDFKTASGATEADAYLVAYYLAPALNRASELTNNRKNTTVTLSAGTQSYDLTSSAIASPVVSYGLQDLADWTAGLIYKTDFYFSDPTTLYFVSNTVQSGTMEFDYYSYYKIPENTYTGADETDLPTNLWPAVIKLAKAYYAEDGMLSGGGTGSGVNGQSNLVELQEANLRKKFAGAGSQGSNFTSEVISKAEAQIKSMGGWSERNNMYSYQII